MSKRILAALMAMALMVSVFAGCRTVTTGEEEPIDEESSVTAEVSSKKPATSSKASTSSKRKRSSSKKTTTTQSQGTANNVVIPDLMKETFYPNGWIDPTTYTVIAPSSSNNPTESTDDRTPDPGTSVYDGYTEYGTFADTLFQALSSRVWMPDGQRIWDDIVEQSGNPITLWGYGAYLEATGAAYAYKKTDSYKSEYEKALKNVMVYQSSDKVNTGRGAASGTYLALTCWPGGADSEIFYDDDVWVLKEYMHAYELLGNQDYLTKADKMLKYILETSWNTTWAGGGLEWMDRLYRGSGSENVQKNTCINAPAMDATLEMYDITGGTNNYYVEEAQKIFSWTNSNLVQLYDKVIDQEAGTKAKRAYIYDKLVFNGADNISLDKFELPYNHGMMIAAAARLYKATNDKDYLDYAKIFADSAYDKWLPRNTFASNSDWGNPWTNSSSPWFNSYLIEGFLTLEKCDASTGKKYVDAAKNALAIACTYKNYGDGTGWFAANWSSTAAPKAKEINVMNQSATARSLYMIASRVAESSSTK